MFSCMYYTISAAVSLLLGFAWTRASHSQHIFPVYRHQISHGEFEVLNLADMECLGSEGPQILTNLSQFQAELVLLLQIMG